MNQKQKSPPAWRAGRALKSQCLAACDFDNNPLAYSLQDIRRAHLAQRYRLTEPMASLVASLAFTTEGARRG